MERKEGMWKDEPEIQCIVRCYRSLCISTALYSNCNTANAVAKHFTTKHLDSV